MPPWNNIWLLMAMALSFGLHFVLLYVETLSVSPSLLLSCCLTLTHSIWCCLLLSRDCVILVTRMCADRRCSLSVL